MLLTANGIKKSFEGVPILDTVSFSVPAGAVVAVLGASGCGKSTLLGILSGTDRADEGTVESTVTRPGPRLAFLRQSERLLPWRTVRDNVAVGAELLGSRRAASLTYAEEMLELVTLTSASSLFPAALSGGMTQRALLARSFATSPQLLLLDEPLAALDVVGRRSLGASIRKYVKTRRAAAIMVTHSVEEVIDVADIVVVLTRLPATVASSFVLEPEFSTLTGYRTLDREQAFKPLFDAVLTALGVSD